MVFKILDELVGFITEAVKRREFFEAVLNVKLKKLDFNSLNPSDFVKRYVSILLLVPSSLSQESFRPIYGTFKERNKVCETIQKKRIFRQLTAKQREISNETGWALRWIHRLADEKVHRIRPHLKNHRTVSEKRVHVSVYVHVTRFYGIRLFAFFTLLFILLVHRKLRTSKPDDSVVVTWDSNIMHIYTISYNFMSPFRLLCTALESMQLFTSSIVPVFIYSITIEYYCVLFN